MLARFRFAERSRRAAVLGALAALAACTAARSDERPVITISGSALGTEGTLLRRQVARFMAAHPDIVVRVQPTPDDATQRHQLFVQWLNAHVGDPDVLQLDVVWTPEFAAAGWILPLDRFRPSRASFFPATIEANEWAGKLYALPWFADVGLLYWRTDLVDHEPRSLDDLVTLAQRAMARPNGPPYGIVWQGARYEGLVTVFQEYLGAFGGRITTDDGRVVVDSPEGVRALTFMLDEITRFHIAPPDVLTWHEEEARFAFQNGTAVFMRNWPYAYALLADSSASRVAGKFAVTAMPAAPGGHPTATLGGAQLAINAYSEHPEAAYALIAYLTAPEQMLERARAVGEYPTRPSLYHDPRLAASVPAPLAQIERAIERATPRPVIPIYTQLSEILQIQLHRALTGQAPPAAALHTAAREMNDLIARTRIRELMARGAGSGADTTGGAR
ncbi:MAG: ABC transporter substrate-binding protein [Gemmatimonadaceae bacterium]|nr:ABC transporter substrate-binding protein [Gemmatimonadaceae bacterium]